MMKGFGVKRLRLIIGNSMGGMHAWLWAVTHPEMMDAVVPMASQPTEMSSRNWMMCRIMIETIKSDPGYNNGDYASQPRMLAIASVFYATATNGGTLAFQNQAPTRAAADKIVEDRLKAPFSADANDWIYQWESSRDYNPSSSLAKITATLLAINSADDERNPPETGLMVEAMKRVKNGKLLLIPASTDTRGHGTTGMATFYKQQIKELLDTAPKRTM